MNEGQKRRYLAMERQRCHVSMRDDVQVHRRHEVGLPLQLLQVAGRQEAPFGLQAGEHCLEVGHVVVRAVDLAGR